MFNHALRPNVLPAAVLEGSRYVLWTSRLTIPYYLTTLLPYCLTPDYLTT